MRFTSAIALLIALGFSCAARADTYSNVAHPSAVWDQSTATLYALGIPGQGQNGLTIIPSAGVATSWTAAQTFSNAIITGGSIKGVSFGGPTPLACGATCTLTAANAGQTTLLNTAAGSVATLPAATGTGNKFSFVVSTTVTSNKDAILAASSSDYLIGIAIGEHSNTPLSFASAAATNHSLQMPFAGTQPSGGFIGDNFVCEDVAANLYQCTGTYQGGTTPTTPFSAATS